MKKIVLMSTATALLAACGADEATETDLLLATEETKMAMDHDMDHTAEVPGELAQASMGRGVVVEVDEPARRLRLDHDAMPAIGMGAMTMVFEAQRGVDVAEVSAGDEVHFVLDRGRDGTYRLAYLCEIGAPDHEACMADMHETVPHDH